MGFAHNPILINDRVASKLVTFAGGTPNAIGDHDGTADPTTLFTVTGQVNATVYGVCGLTLVGAATIEVGVAGSTASVIAQIADATDLATGELYLDATPTTTVEALPAKQLIKADIIMTLASADITAGNITFYAIWEPVTSGSSLVAA